MIAKNNREVINVDNHLPKWYLSQRKAWRHNYDIDNFKATIKETKSPCNEFIFVVESYQKQEKGWENYTYYKGIILPNNSAKKFNKIELFSMTYKFWHFWAQHEDNVYLVCNENKYGYTVVDVKYRKIIPFIDPKKEWSFSWKEVLPSPDGKLLAVQGDYMEAVRELALYDISDPTNVPFPRIKTLGNVKSGYVILKKWDKNKIVMEHVQAHKNTILIEDANNETRQCGCI